MKGNPEGIRKAESLIAAHQYVLDSSWAAANPSAEEENAQIDRHGWDGYGEWYMAIDTDAAPETKDRFNYPYGDFRRVHRSALISAKQRASQYGHTDVEEAAAALLTKLDKLSEKSSR